MRARFELRIILAVNKRQIDDQVNKRLMGVSKHGAVHDTKTHP